jgi:hypothetical protein
MHHRALGRAVRAGTFGALAVAVTTISLVPPAGAARSHPAVASPARPAIPMHTLTIKGTNLAGKPDTGDSVLVLNVDNTRTLDQVQSQQPFDRGLRRLEQRKGGACVSGAWNPISRNPPRARAPPAGPAPAIRGFQGVRPPGGFRRIVPSGQLRRRAQPSGP